MTKLYSYVLDHDYGFAPNPFFGVCTLATCKPKIRERAPIGAYIVGTGCAKRGRRGRLVYFMRVDEITNYNDYWEDPRFAKKKPYFFGSKMRAFGDNIYHSDRKGGPWQQAPSFHSFPDGKPNALNVETDTASDRVLIGHDFAYWGGSGPEIPRQFREYEGSDVCAGRAYKTHFPGELASEFVDWVRRIGCSGQIGAPADWARMP